MPGSTTTASAIEHTSTSPVLMLAFELGEESWLLGFSAGFGGTKRRAVDFGGDATPAPKVLGFAARSRDGPNFRC